MTAPLQRLWSPWRSRYVQDHPEMERVRDDRSLFRQIWEEDRDRENFILWRGEVVFAALNRYPYNPGHLLLLPVREVETFGALSPEERDGLMDLSARAMDWLEAALEPDSFQVGVNLGRAAGAGVPEHLHVHVVPRWKGEEGRPEAALDADGLESALREIYDALREVVRETEEL